MIITRLIGGIGNQLFQYAVGRHLADTQKTILKLDIFGFEKYEDYDYSLGAFNIQENFFITAGNYVVIDILQWDEKNNSIHGLMMKSEISSARQKGARWEQLMNSDFPMYYRCGTHCLKG